MPAEWTIRKIPEETTMVVHGEIDFTVTPEFRVELHNFINETSGEMKLDLSGLDYLDSSGLASLIEARRIMVQKGRAITITAVTDQVDRLLHLTQMKPLFNMA